MNYIGMEIAEKHSADTVSVGPLIQEGRVVFSPSDARYILDFMLFDKQRQIRPRQVAVLLHLINSGALVKDHVLHFGQLGDGFFLVDGQHRLAAVAESGAGHAFYVVIHKVHTKEGLADLFSSFNTNDLKRTPADILKAHDISLVHGLTYLMTTNAYKAAYLIESNFDRSKLKSPEAHNVKNRVGVLSQWWSEASTVQYALSGVDRQLKTKMMAAGCLAVAFVTLRHQNKSALNFWARVAEWVGLKKGDPRLTLSIDLRNRDLGAKGGTGAGEKACAFAWNAWFQGREAKTIKVSASQPVRILGTPWE